jgi:hypothetical protein
MSSTAEEDLTVSEAVQRPPNHLQAEAFLAHKRV